MAITLAAFQRFRWLLVAAVLASVVVLLSRNSGTPHPRRQSIFLID
jgi:hypothetical protein